MLKVKVRTQEYRMNMLATLQFTVKYGSKWERESWYIDGRAQEFGFRLSACSREDR